MPGTKETKLITSRVSMAHAAKACGERKEDSKYKYCVMVVEPERLSCDFIMSIPEGFHAVGSSHGQFIGMWPSGFKTLYPWERVSHLVTKQYVVYDTPVKECPTQDDVMVEVDVNVVFRVMEGEENIKNFIYRLGPERLTTMLKAYQEETVRGMARQKKYTNIYDLMDTGELPEFVEKKGQLPDGEIEAEAATYEDDDGAPIEKKNAASQDDDSDDEDNVLEQLANAKRGLNDRLQKFGIEVYRLTITNVRLPIEFRNQMEEATTFHSKNLEQESKQKYDLMVIENTEQRYKANQICEEEKEEAIVKKDQRAAKETKTIDIFRAETRSIVAVIKEEMKADVREIATASELRISQLNAEKDELLASISASANGEIESINADLEGFIIQAEAEAQKKVAELKAQETLLLARNEQLMGKRLVSKRDFDSKMANLLVLDKMAKNMDCVMSGTSYDGRDQTVATLAAARNAAVCLGLKR